MSDQRIVEVLQALAIAKKSDIQKTIKFSPSKEEKEKIRTTLEPEDDSRSASDSTINNSSMSSSSSTLSSSMRFFDTSSIPASKSGGADLPLRTDSLTPLSP